MRKLVILASAITLLLTASTTVSEAKGNCSKSTACPAKKAVKAGVYRVTMTKSGGFAGIMETYEVDSNKLDKDERANFADIINKTGILAVDSVKDTEPKAADVFFYEIKVEYKGKTHTATYDDIKLPDAYRTLVGYLTKMGTKTKTR
jgi:hypothetical protein